MVHGTSRARRRHHLRHRPGLLPQQERDGRVCRRDHRQRAAQYPDVAPAAPRPAADPRRAAANPRARGPAAPSNRAGGERFGDELRYRIPRHAESARGGAAFPPPPRPGRRADRACATGRALLGMDQGGRQALRAQARDLVGTARPLLGHPRGVTHRRDQAAALLFSAAAVQLVDHPVRRSRLAVVLQ